MPSYFYHLKFELYPTPNPIAEASESDREATWLPPRGAGVFDDLPFHPRPDRQTTYQVPTSDYPRPGSTNHIHPYTLAGQNSSSSSLGIIDCGAAARAPVKESDRKIEIVSERQWLERANSFPPPNSSVAIHPQTAVRDWRFGRVSIETVDLRTAHAMAGEASRTGPSAAPLLGPTFGGAGTATKAKFLPLETKNTELGWGVVHFYREGDETPGLVEVDHHDSETANLKDDDCTTLCIPAVPAYMSPGDLMGFVGEKWTGDISHCRMVMTSRMNRYLVLLKFRDNFRAKQWRREFDGRVFNTMESSTALSPLSSSAGMSSSLRPFPPPTPNLVELPTCPVCLERMDETNGLMTIPCAHVFHCTCLQNWKGAGCPVCRFTNTSPDAESDPTNPHTQPFGSGASNLCSVCDCTDDLWICLICGYVGCGRYKGGHAKDHWKETAHCFALELETQHVWDYAGDIKTVDKASKASATAEEAAAQASKAMERLTLLDAKYTALSQDTIPELEKQLARERNKANKSETLARNLSKSLQEEKRLNEGLMERIEHLNRDHQAMIKEVEKLKEDNAELQETNRDLSMFISGQEKLKELENEGKIEEGELEGGSASVPEKKSRRRGKR
ncbi:hypothetical protein QYS62_010035 [Fusarium acuminatum]|uniref:Uncharacterized protein n=1 Tax=Fusarium acuminatum TaxID=5515 RepID=A0ABZ2X7N4_9HYPO